jgi:hypothetical protein
MESAVLEAFDAVRAMSVMDQRREFVRLAMHEAANRRELCKRFGISPDAG